MAVKRLTNARLQFGSTYSGYRLFFYVAGSSTKQNTYTSSSGLVANYNPIVLNSLGVPDVEIWLTAGASYKLGLAIPGSDDPPSGFVWTEDNITGVNDTTTTVDEWVIGPTPTYVSATSLTLVGDQTTVFHLGRRLKLITSGGTVYGSITASAYTTLTTITVTLDSGVLDSGLSAVYYGLHSANSSGMPLIGYGAGTPTPVEGLTESNIAVGLNALISNTTGYENTACGVWALRLNTTGNENNAIGALSMGKNTTGEENVGIGVRALGENTTGSTNVAVGHACMNYNTTGTENSALGQTALYHNTTGTQNTAVGRQSLQTNTTGGFNCAFGHSSLNTSDGADYNCAFGRQALYNTTTGSSNAAFGKDCLLDVTTGSSNTAIGTNTGQGITTGSNNTIVGANITGLAGALGSNIILGDGTGAIKLQWTGSLWKVTGPALFNTSTDRTGQIGIDHNGAGRYGIQIHNTDTGSSGQTVMEFTRGVAVTVVGSISATNTTTTYSTSSDYRLKKDFAPMVGALDRIKLLRPLTYKWRIDDSYGEGFIAHELQEVFPVAVTGEKDALTKSGGVLPQSIDTSHLVAALVAAVQEMAEKIERLEKGMS